MASPGLRNINNVQKEATRKERNKYLLYFIELNQPIYQIHLPITENGIRKQCVPKCSFYSLFFFFFGEKTKQKPNTPQA